MKRCKVIPILTVFIVVFLLVIPGCAQEPAPVESQPDAPAPVSPTESPTDAPTPEPTPAASERATYEIYFNATWSAETHPGNYDSTAHFSPFIATIYDGTAGGRIFEPGQLASAGMEQMAETGATDLLEGEISQLITAGNIVDFIKGQRIDSPGVDSGLLGFSQTSSYVMFVSMIAPSPDWFVTADINLFENGKWLEEIEVPLISYDSGTDNGTTLTAADIDTNPPEPIFILGNELQNMGTLQLVKID